jgi:hypothetical protein
VGNDIYTANYALEIQGQAVPDLVNGTDPNQNFTPDAGRFLVTTGNPTGQRTANWGNWIDTYRIGASDPPTLLQLAELDKDVYNGRTSGLDDGSYVPYGPLAGGSESQFEAQAYINSDDSQVVIAIRGSVASPLLFSFKNWTTDIASFGTGIPSAGFDTMVAGASNYLAQIVAKLQTEHPDANITLTGHSLGGAIAQVLGEASGYTTETFNAPGAAALYGNVSSQLQPASDLASNNPAPGINANYRKRRDYLLRSARGKSCLP